MFGWVLRRKKLLADREALGKWGEKKAEKFLKAKGMTNLARNFSCKTGELDLVMAQPDGTIVFVEVKTRTQEKFANAEDAATKPKQTRLSNAAKYFLSSNSITDRPLRFDFIAVILPQSGPPQIRHYENAFRP